MEEEWGGGGVWMVWLCRGQQRWTGHYIKKKDLFFFSFSPFVKEKYIREERLFFVFALVGSQPFVIMAGPPPPSHPM